MILKCSGDYIGENDPVKILSKGNSNSCQNIASGIISFKDRVKQEDFFMWPTFLKSDNQKCLKQSLLSIEHCRENL